MKPTRQLKVANYKSTIKILDATNAQVAHLENWDNAVKARTGVKSWMWTTTKFDIT